MKKNMIHEMELSQLDEIMEIWLNTNKKAHDFIPKDYWENNYEMVKEMLPKARIYVYEVDNECAGFIGIMDSYIAGLFIKELYQSKGYGTSLLSHVKQKYHTLSLQVYEKNEKAIRFYEKEGFVRILEQIDENIKEVEFVMQWNC